MRSAGRVGPHLGHGRRPPAEVGRIQEAPLGVVEAGRRKLRHSLRALHAVRVAVRAAAVDAQPDQRAHGPRGGEAKGRVAVAAPPEEHEGEEAQQRGDQDAEQHDDGRARAGVAHEAPAGRAEAGRGSAGRRSLSVRPGRRCGVRCVAGAGAAFGIDIVAAAGGGWLCSLRICVDAHGAYAAW